MIWVSITYRIFQVFARQMGYTIGLNRAYFCNKMLVSELEV